MPAPLLPPFLLLPLIFLLATTTTPSFLPLTLPPGADLCTTAPALCTPALAPSPAAYETAPFTSLLCSGPLALTSSPAAPGDEKLCLGAWGSAVSHPEYCEIFSVGVWNQYVAIRTHSALLGTSFFVGIGRAGDGAVLDTLRFGVERVSQLGWEKGVVVAQGAGGMWAVAERGRERVVRADHLGLYTLRCGQDVAWMLKAGIAVARM
ncbi:MAG: hypothetical protein M1829_003415 [Trizodia sp. TS-e1964]|nr:MAG: hypothetical protein M1829_003415 [Trizodia sp. TS-e1964]